jgi:hypothetical protein
VHRHVSIDGDICITLMRYLTCSSDLWQWSLNLVTQLSSVDCQTLPAATAGTKSGMNVADDENG